MRMWTAIRKREISGKHSEKTERNNNLMKTKRIGNTKKQASRWPGIYI